MTRTQFVFVLPCGCPIGLVEGSYAETEAGAWDILVPSYLDERRRLRDRGVTVHHVTHDEYTAKYYPLMGAGCNHA